MGSLDGIGTLGFDSSGVRETCCVMGKYELFICVKVVFRSRSFVVLILNYDLVLIASFFLLCLVAVVMIVIARTVLSLIHTDLII